MLADELPSFGRTAPDQDSPVVFGPHRDDAGCGIPPPEPLVLSRLFGDDFVVLGHLARGARGGGYVPDCFDSPGLNTSTEKVKLRPSPGWIAPTPTTWRDTSSPLSLRTVTRTEYSQDCPFSGCLSAPSSRSAEKLGAARAAAPGSKRRCFLQAGQLVALWRITARQWGQSRVAPAADDRTVLTTRG